MWNVKDFTGTLYTIHDTELGHLLQSVYWLDNQQWHEFYNIIPWEYHNIASIVAYDIKNWDGFYNLNTVPLVNPENDYCSVLTSGDGEKTVNQMAWSFMHIFDLQLHDAAVTYTYKAAHSNEWKEAEIYASIACSLWGYSRQLRVDANRPKCQEAIKQILSNLNN